MPATTLRLPANNQAPARARTELARFLAPEELTQELLGDAELLTNELVTNSVRHSALEATDQITMECELDARRLRVRVSDAGGPFLVGGPATDVGGWGLLLVAEVSDRWAIQRNVPNAVWFELDR